MIHYEIKIYTGNYDFGVIVTESNWKLQRKIEIILKLI